MFHSPLFFLLRISALFSPFLTQCFLLALIHIGFLAPTSFLGNCITSILDADFPADNSQQETSTINLIYITAKPFSTHGWFFSILSIYSLVRV